MLEEPVSWATLQLIECHAQHLQRGLETFSRDWLSSPQAHEQPLVQSWVASRLHASSNRQGLPPGLPTGSLDLWNGWLNHDTSQFPAAQILFHRAWIALRANTPECWSTELADAALGLGRTHTRSGHWEKARGWLLCALAIARRVGNESLCFKGYGALGELLLRAGHSSAGFTCLNMAYHLLPAGSGQRARQLNYIGSALRRLNEHLRAESVLMTSFSMATDQRDIPSQWHALARLQFLALSSSSNSDMTRTLPSFACDNIGQAPAVARGFWRLARARTLMQGQPEGTSTPDTLALINQAAQDFEAGRLPMEQCWATLWYHHLTGDPVPWQLACEVMKTQMHMPCIAPPDAIGVLDTSFANLPLGPRNGFSGLLAIPANLAHLKALDNLFFV